MEKKNLLEYTCPSHGGWGMVRTGMLVPQSHQLFVCPSACGRHGALGAIKQGLKNRLSYLYLDESDVISGYDNAIIEAVGELFDRLEKKPKVLLVFVSCLDDLIGTDCDAVIEELSQIYPQVQFRMCHMNPIATDSKEPPQKGIWKNMYSLMECNVEKRLNKVNTLGNLIPVNEKSEMYDVLKAMNIDEICHIGKCSSYEELRDMGNNCLNLVVSAQADRAAKIIKQNQNMEYIEVPISYNYERIIENYKLIFNKLIEMGIAKKEQENQINEILDENKKIAIKAIKGAKEKIGDTKIYLDYSAFANPFKMAKFMIEQGFNVVGVYAKDIDENEEEYQWIIANTDVEVANISGHNMLNQWKVSQEGISIGLEAAYVSGTKHIVSIFQDEEMYGFYGICKIMKLLCEAIEKEENLEEKIKQVGLVV